VDRVKAPKRRPPSTLLGKDIVSLYLESTLSGRLIIWILFQDLTVSSDQDPKTTSLEVNKEPAPPIVKDNDVMKRPTWLQELSIKQANRRSYIHEEAKVTNAEPAPSTLLDKIPPSSLLDKVPPPRPPAPLPDQLTLLQKVI